MEEGWGRNESSLSFTSHTHRMQSEEGSSAIKLLSRNAIIVQRS